jgi:hypothetical protein
MAVFRVEDELEWWEEHEYIALEDEVSLHLADNSAIVSFEGFC